MGQNNTGNCSPSVSFTQTPATGFLAGTTLPINLTLAAVFKAAGVLADQINLVHAKTYAFTASTPITIDLTALVDILGNAVNFARVRFLAFRIQNVVDGQNLLVGNSVTNEWNGFLTATGKMTIFPSSPTATAGINNTGFTIVSAPNTTGIPVTPTSKTLKLDPGAVALTVDVVIAGCDV